MLQIHKMEEIFQSKSLNMITINNSTILDVKVFYHIVKFFAVIC